MTVRHAACLSLVLLGAAAMAAESGPETAAERWSPYTLFRKPPRPAATAVS